MLFNDTYRKYFEHQAKTHPELLHVPGVDKTFDMISIEEAVAGFRNSVNEKGYILRAVVPTFRIGSDNTHEIRKHLNGGFVIAHYFNFGEINNDSFFLARDKAEKVGDEIIEKMIADSSNSHPLFYRSMSSKQDVSGQPVLYTGDSTYTGWLYTFNIFQWWRNCLNHEDAPDWTDGGITPHIL